MPFGVYIKFNEPDCELPVFVFNFFMVKRGPFMVGLFLFLSGYKFQYIIGLSLITILPLLGLLNINGASIMLFLLIVGTLIMGGDTNGTV